MLLELFILVRLFYLGFFFFFARFSSNLSDSFGIYDSLPGEEFKSVSHYTSAKLPLWYNFLCLVPLSKPMLLTRKFSELQLEMTQIYCINTLK